MSKAKEILKELRAAGLTLRCESGKIRYSGPKGIMNEAYLAALKEHRDEIVRLLQEESNSGVIERIPRGGKLPVSFAQQQLWFLDQMMGPNNIYNMAIGISMKGALDIDALKRAFEKLLKRHEILRASFVENEAKPFMQISESLPLPFRFADISKLPESFRQDEAARLIESESGIPFDLRQAPLLRSLLIRLSADEFALMVCCHHIVVDGWSMGTIISDLKDLYNAELGKGEPPAALPVQYADFAAWQRAFLNDERIESEIEFWKGYLREMPELSTMPPDFPRPSVQDFSGSTTSTQLPPRLVAKLSSAAREMKTTLNLLLSTAFSLTLSRFSGQDDVLVGTALANRLRPELEPVVGMFVNALPMRLNLSGSLKFSEYAERASQSGAKLLQHSQIPFERLVESLEVSRELGHSPIIQTYFTLLPPLGAPPAFSGLEAGWLKNKSNISKFDLSLYAEELAGGEMDLSLEYATAIFSKESAELWLRSLVALLESVAESPEIKVDELALCSAQDREAVSKWQYGEIVEHKENSVLALFNEQARKRPDALAVDDGKLRLSYSELDRLSNRLAAFLSKERKGQGYIGLCIPRSTDAVTAILGIVKSKAAYVPLDPEQPSERLGCMIEDAGLDIVLASQKTIELLNSLPQPPVKIVDIAAFLDLEKSGAEDAGAGSFEIPQESPAYVIYTSGSTGRPKGVVIPHKGLLHIVKWHVSEFKIDPSDTCSQISSLSFDASVPEIWAPLCVGACVKIVPSDCRLDPFLLQEWILKSKISYSFFSTSMAELLLQLDWPQDASLRSVLTGGDTLRTRPKPNMPFRFCNLYGPTENSVISTFFPVPPEGAHAPEIGWPLPNTSCFVLKEREGRLIPVPPGVFAELFLGGDGLAVCYLNNPEFTAERFIHWSPKTFRLGKDEPGAMRIYRSGDLARFRPSGLIEFGGRADRQVKLRGYRIEPGEIEAAMKRHDAVKDALVAVRGEGAEKQLCAYFTFKGADPGRDAMIKHLKEHVPSYMVPVHFIALEEFPLLPSGKIDRAKLPKPLKSQQPGKKAAPDSELESLIGKIWEETLGLDSPGHDDNFFDIGGQSLLLLKVRKRLKDSGWDVKIVDLFRYPTIASLGKFLAQSKKSPQKQAEQGADEPATAGANSASARGDIAIIGMAGRFPGAESIGEFWENLLAEKECVSFFSHEELRNAGVPEKLFLNPDYVPANGILKDVGSFDNEFFAIPPGEAERIDPQQRLLLECAWEAFENAGHVPGEEPGKRVGVFVGTSFSPYFLQNFPLDNDGLPEGGFSSIIGTSRDFAATRIAYKLNLKGPAVNVQTACSTSLVAVHMAAQALHSGQCEMALAGGATVYPRQVDGYVYEESGTLSPDGHCRAFDAEANGTVGGNGLGLVLLKPFDDALRDGDRIWARIKGSAINNDGSDKVGFAAPSVNGQLEAIRAAHRDACVKPSDISYVEAHGTGTVLGDPIEMNALREAFGSGAKHCAVGSLKTNIGHLDSAAGVAGLIKTCLALKHKVIPKTLHFHKLNPEINLDGSPLYVSGSTAKWEGKSPLRAGVSSFGMGGTNAHVVLEEAGDEASPRRPFSPRQAEIIVLSARSEESLRKIRSQLASFIESNPDLELRDIAFTLSAGRKAFPLRHAFTASSRDIAIRKLRAADAESAKARRMEMAFLFTGQGSQYPGMGKELLLEPVFKEVVDRCAEILKGSMKEDIRDIAWSETPEAAAKLASTRFAQPALFVFEYALAQLWMAWGLRPDYMIGHSVGEWIAAAISEVFPLEDCLSLVALRGELMDKQAPGKMLAAALSEKEAANWTSDRISLATVNEERQCVLSGPEKDIDELAARLSANQIRCSKLNTSHAFHSSMMDPALKPFSEAVAKAKRSAPKIPFVSNVSGAWISDEEACSPQYWAAQIRSTVRFAKGLEAVLADESVALLEIGSKRTLANMALRAKQRKGQPVLASSGSNPSQIEPRDLAEAAAQLWSLGFAFDWGSYYRNAGCRRAGLPSYPFERKFHWLRKGDGKDAGFQELCGELRKAELGLWKETPLKLIADQPELAELSEKICGLSARKALAELFPKLKAGERLDIDAMSEAVAQKAPGMQRLLMSMIRMLEEDGFLRREASGVFLAEKTPSEGELEKAFEDAKKKAPDFAQELAYLLHCASEAGNVLKGRRKGIEVVEESGGFSEDKTSRLDERALYAKLTHELLRLLLKRQSKPLRILEVGGGSGMLLEEFEPTLKKGSLKYLFTDISRAFVNDAKERFGACMEFATLDVSGDPLDQGFAPASYDLILGLNVAHATPCLKESLRNLRLLLAPHGILALIEDVRSRRAKDLIWGLCEGWWSYADAELRGESPLLPAEAWKRLLEESGLKAAAFPETAGFAARSDCALLLGWNPSAVEAGSRTKAASPAKAVSRKAPESELESIVAEAMADVLGLESVGRDDDFFALGGDSLLALQLSSRLKREHDLKVPKESLLKAPSPMSVAKALAASEEQEPPLGCLLKFNEGPAELQPLFLIHPVGGGALCYRDLVNELKTPCSVYGLQSPGLLDNEPPLKSVPEMAVRYLDDIEGILKAHKRDCVLMGHSFGGLVAFEMCKLMENAGKAPAMTVLLDSPGLGHMPKDFNCEEELMAYFLSGENPDEKWESCLQQLRSMPQEERETFFLENLKDLLQEYKQISLSLARSIYSITKINMDAMRSYRPEKVESPILFFKAEERDRINVQTPEKAWESMTRQGLKVVNVPGNHLSMLSKPHVGVLAKEIRRELGMAGLKL